MDAIDKVYVYHFKCANCGEECYMYSQDVPGYEGRIYTDPSNPMCHCTPHVDMAFADRVHLAESKFWSGNA